MSGTDVRIICNCQPDLITCYLKILILVCVGLSLSFINITVAVGSQMSKYSKLNLYAVQRKTMRFGDLPRNSLFLQ